MLSKWQVKKLNFQRLKYLLNSDKKKEVCGTFYRTTAGSGEKRKTSAEKISEKLERTSK